MLLAGTFKHSGEAEGRLNMPAKPHSQLAGEHIGSQLLDSKSPTAGGLAGTVPPKGCIPQAWQRLQRASFPSAKRSPVASVHIQGNNEHVNCLLLSFRFSFQSGSALLSGLSTCLCSLSRLGSRVLHRKGQEHTAFQKSQRTPVSFLSNRRAQQRLLHTSLDN